MLVEGKNAEELMGLVNKNEEAKVIIEVMAEQPKWVSTETRTHTPTSLWLYPPQKGSLVNGHRAGGESMVMM